MQYIVSTHLYLIPNCIHFSLQTVNLEACMSADQLKTLFHDEHVTTTPSGISFLSEITVDEDLSTLSRLGEEII